MTQLDRAAYMRNAMYIAGWYTASTFLSIYNKQLFGDKYWNFRSPVGASALHNIIQFSLASLVIHVIAPHRFANFRSTFSFTDFQSGYLYYALPTAIGAAADVALSNTSLRYITLPAYIYVKNSTPIFVLLTSWALGLEKITPRLIVIILVIFTGVCLAVKGEAVYTPYGMMLAFIASAFSGLRWSLTQLFMKWNARRGSSGGSALTTLYTFTPFMAIVLSVASMTMEPMDTRVFEGDVGLTVVLLMGGFLAFTMVVSEFLLIHGSSVLALSVAGLAKEIVLISAAMVVFGDTLTLQNVLGLVISLAGIIWFNYYRNATAAAARSRTPSPSPSARRGNTYRMVRTKPIEAEL